ncbi:WD40 repeat-like protein, partial [Mycena pura]
YDRAARPSEHTTPLARFSKTRLRLPTNASPELTAFAEARCEILSDDMCLPTSMGIADDVVVVIGAGGWKQRSPTLLIERLDRVSTGYAPFGTLHPGVGLAEVANELCLDSSRKLMYVADSSRVKSYAWNYDGEDGTTLPVHTLDSHGFEDALFLRNNGAKIMRSGTKGLAIWDIDGLPTHGEDGEDRVGKKLKNIDTMRDDDEAEEIERSSGAPPTQTLSAPPITRITVAKNHPSNQAQILAMHRSVFGRDYNVVSVDLETQQIAMRFLGHSASPSCIATNSTDPNGFVTAAFDGGVRLYDVRQPTPRFAIDHGDEKLCTALYESIGGQPFIIYGTDKSEQIKVWDVRSRKPMYELATGNTAVRSLAWDARRQTLLAATECIYRDRVGNVHDYRPAKIGSHGREWLGDGDAHGEHEGEDKDEDWEDEDEDEDEDDEDDEERWWPDRAWHAETSFGVALDCADHMLFRYQFKSDADPKVLPEYGQAGASLADSYW